MEEFLTCPYNPSHNILKSKMITHLVKCEKQHKKMNLKKCPFNSTHRIAEKDLQHHKTVCPDRIEFEKKLIVIENNNSNENDNNGPKYPPLKQSVVEEEDWEDDIGTHHFNPKKAAESKPVFRSNTGMTKAEKRAFAKSEPERILKIQKSDI